MSAHTAGTWVAKQRFSNRWTIEVAENLGASPLCIAQVSTTVLEVGINNHDTAANARLIAAAPDLLEALRTLDERLHDCFEPRHQITAEEAYDSFYQEIVRDAIAKATGVEA